VIVLDTHIWVWWVHGDPALGGAKQNILSGYESDGFGVSVISCWEVAKLVEKKRLILPCATEQWLNQALAYPGMRLIPLTPEIALESTRLPLPFHDDPADQMIVATARLLGYSLATDDRKILAYSHVQLVWRS